ncbi:MAG: A/G-specific adenine glycosylase [Myxococcales bacterium]|nr:MAG: A/G-specific adenine glycosylase [Myxococcales bacterium]
MIAWVSRLLRWYKANRRALPWRERPTPYRVWVSEVMLQQTQVETVIPYYERFLTRFPSAEALAAADLQDVLKLWEGLGYYARARNLHRAAALLVKDHAGRLPETCRELRMLPGMGDYTAAAVASIAFGESAPVVDGNVLRVFSRFWAIEDDIRQMKTRLAIAERLQAPIGSADPSMFNQAVMELGALVCRPKNPACPACPLAKECRAFLGSRTAELPLRAARKATPHYEIAVGAAWRRGRLLIGRRRTGQMLGGLWEFPGGKRKSGETLEETVIREFREETGLAVRPRGVYCTIRHAYSHFSITMTVFDCETLSGRARPKSAEALKWVRLDELDVHPFPAATVKAIRAIRKALA